MMGPIGEHARAELHHEPSRRGGDDGEVYTLARMIPKPDERGGAVISVEHAEFIEAWPRTAEGAITAVNRAAQLSRHDGPVELLRPDGRMMARYERGRRADLPAGGIVHLAEARAAING